LVHILAEVAHLVWASVFLDISDDPSIGRCANRNTKIYKQRQYRAGDGLEVVGQSTFAGHALLKTHFELHVAVLLRFLPVRYLRR
jgi:hypothetical protein